MNASTSAHKAAAHPAAYDLVPYASYPFPHLHPARIAATVQLRGMQPPPVATARVLDIGCGSGGHVIALAGFYPQMQLVGVDVAAGQIEQGQQRLRALGLSNVSLHAGNLAQGLPPSAIKAAQAFGGQFDYILCQGVYYVVPDAVRSAIWQILRQHLAPRGIAHISFNTYPGWKQREVAQDFAQFHVQKRSHTNAHPATAEQKEQAVRDGLGKVAAMAPKQAAGLTSGYGESLQAEAQAAAHAMPGLLFHEFLSGENRPLYFHAMAEQASLEGFAYLCEAALPDAWPGRWGAVAQPLREMAAGDPLLLEQYIDFATARTYRNSLWIAHSAASALPLLSGPWPSQALAGLHLAVDRTPIAASAGAAPSYLSTSGVSFSAAAHAGALESLLSQAGAPLWRNAQEILAAHPGAAALIHECVLLGLINAWKEPPSLSHLRPGQAWDWLRRDAQSHRAGYVVTVWHQSVRLAEEERKWLALADGQASLDEAMACLGDQAVAQWVRFGWLA